MGGGAAWGVGKHGVGQHGGGVGQCGVGSIGVGAWRWGSKVGGYGSEGGVMVGWDSIGVWQCPL